MCECVSRSPWLQVLSPTELGALELEGMSVPAWGWAGGGASPGPVPWLRQCLDS